MQQSFRIPFVHWLWYVGVFIGGGIAVIVGTQRFSEVIGISYFLVFYAIFCPFLFARFSSIVLKGYNVRKGIRLSFFLAHAAILLMGFGVLPLALYERVANDRNAFLFFSPTGGVSLLVAAGTAFACYLAFAFFVRRIFESAFRKYFAVRKFFSKEFLVTTLVITAVVLFFLWRLLVIFDDPSFAIAFPLMPFMRFVFLVLDGIFVVPGVLLAVLFLVSYIVMLRSSIAKEAEKSDQPLFYDFILLSKSYVRIHLLLWIVYLKALGAVLEVGSSNLFPF